MIPNGVMEWWSILVLSALQHSITPSLHYSIAPGRNYPPGSGCQRLLPQQFALPLHQTALVLFPVPGQRAECGPAGNQRRVDVQFRGPPVASLAQAIIPALFGGTRPVTGGAVPVRPLRGGQLQGALHRRVDPVPAPRRETGRQERQNCLVLGRSIGQGDERLMPQDEIRRPVGSDRLDVTPVPQRPQDGQTA